MVTMVLAEIGDIERVMFRLSSVAWNPTRLLEVVSESLSVALPDDPDSDPFAAYSIVMVLSEQLSRSSITAANAIGRRLKNERAVDFIESRFKDFLVCQVTVQILCRGIAGCLWNSGMAIGGMPQAVGDVSAGERLYL